MSVVSVGVPALPVVRTGMACLLTGAVSVGFPLGQGVRLKKKSGMRQDQRECHQKPQTKPQG